jgi:hypothetical protein
MVIYVYSLSTFVILSAPLRLCGKISSLIAVPSFGGQALILVLTSNSPPGLLRKKEDCSRTCLPQAGIPADLILCLRKSA